MAGKSWRLVVTDLGGSAPISEARVEAGNWMTALTLARKEIGESGGVPPGASCSVAPDGKVTIQDAVARKTYVLAPDTEESLVEAKKPSGPRVPAESVPRPQSSPPGAVSVPKPSDRPPAQAAQNKKVSTRTVAYDARELGLAPPGAAAPSAATPSAPASSPPEAAKKPAPNRTIAYDARELGLAGATPGAAPPPEAEKPPDKSVPKRTVAYDARELGLAPPNAATPSATEPSKDMGAKKAVPNRTIAYDARELGIAGAAPGSGRSQPAAPSAEAKAPASKSPGTAPGPANGPASEPAKPAKKKPVSKRTIAYDAKELGLAPPGEPSAPDEAPDRPTLPEAAPPTSGGGEQWKLLHARDEEPTPETPLTYRERVYVVAAGTSGALLEVILQARFEELREELADRPKGKLVNMALFDHEWTERPSRPPLVTLQWKDWRGEPIIQTGPRPAASQPAPAPEPAQAQPAPAPQPTSAQPAPASQPAPAPQPVQAQPAPAPQPAPQPAPAPQPVQAQPASSSQPAPAPQPAQSQPPPASQPAPAPQPAQSEPAPAGEVAASSPSPSSGRASQPAPTAQPAPPEPAPPAGDDDLGLSISDEVVDSAPRLAPARVNAGDDPLAAAFEHLQDLFFLTTPVEGLEFVTRLLEDLVPSEAITACLYDINSDELRFVALRGPGSDERKGEGVPRLSGLMGSAALQPGAVILVEDVAADERYDPGVDGRIGVEPLTMALVGVSHQGRLMGLLQLINRQSQPQFSRADANLLAYVGDKLGEFLQAARMRPDERHAR